MALNRKRTRASKNDKKKKNTPVKKSEITIVERLSDEDAFESSSSTVLFSEKDKLFLQSENSSLSYPSPSVEPSKARVGIAKVVKLYSPFKSGLVISLEKGSLLAKGFNPSCSDSYFMGFVQIKQHDDNDYFGLVRRLII